MAATDMAGGDEHAHPAPSPGVDGRTVNRDGPAGGHVDTGQRGQVGHSSRLTHLRPLYSLLSVSQSDRDFDLMASQMQDEALDLAQVRGRPKAQPTGGKSTQLTETRASDRYTRKPARVTTPSHPSAKPPPKVLVVSPQSDVRNVVVDRGTDHRRARSP